MRNITKVLLATSLAFVFAILTFTFSYDMAVSYSSNIEEKEVEEPKEVEHEDKIKKVEEPEETEEEKDNGKILFYSGMFLLIILVGAMLVIFLSKIEE